MLSIAQVNEGFCGCDSCAEQDASGNLLRACKPDCECACECVAGRPGCDIDPYADCSERVAKFSYTHPIYDTIDCSCPSGSDCAGQFDNDEVEFKTNMCRAWCSECSPGCFSDSPDVGTCDDCNAGYYTSKYGMKECDACHHGKYSAGGGAVGGGACKLCPEGTYTSNDGQAACTPAPEGTYIDFEGAYCLPYAGDKHTTCDMINATEQVRRAKRMRTLKHYSLYD